MKPLAKLFFSLAVLILMSASTYGAEESKATIYEDNKINGYFESQDGNFKIRFKLDQSIKYQVYKNKNLGVYEPSSCSLTNNTTGKTISQGNMMFYFDRAQCCYNVKLRGGHLMMGAVWGKPTDHQCPIRILLDKTQWGEGKKIEHEMDGETLTLTPIIVKTNDPYFSD